MNYGWSCPASRSSPSTRSCAKPTTAARKSTNAGQKVWARSRPPPSPTRSRETGGRKRPVRRREAGSPFSYSHFWLPDLRIYANYSRHRLFQFPFRVQYVAHLRTARQILYAAAHVCLMAFEAGLVIGGLESHSPRLFGRQVTHPAGLDPSGDHVFFEDGGVEPMAFRTRLNLHRAVLVVAIDATPR